MHPFSIVKGPHYALLSSLIWWVLYSKPDSEGASKQIAPLKPLRLFYYLQESPSPIHSTCTSQICIKKQKNTGWLEHISFSYSMTVFDFLSLHSFLSCLPLLVQLAALRPQEAIRYGKTSPYCFNEIPSVCSFLNEPRTDKDFFLPGSCLQWWLSFGCTGLGRRLATFGTSHYSCINLSGKFHPSFFFEKQTHECWTIHTLPITHTYVNFSSLSRV